MTSKYLQTFLLTIAGLLLMTLNANAFTTADIYESIITAHDDDQSISDVKKVKGKNNAWTMKFLTKTAETEMHESMPYGIPTKIIYKGSRLHVTQQLAAVDYRVVKDVFEDGDVSDQLESLANYDAMMSDLTGFEAKVTHDGLRMNLKGSISVAGKTLEQVRNILVDLREETDELYFAIDEANRDELEEYFEEVLDKNYGILPDTQTFIEVLGHGFSKENQKRRKESEIGHWSWNVGDIQTETVNHGRYFEEVFLLSTGTDISEYKTEKMYEDITKRLKTRLPKGAASASVRPHAVESGVTAVVLKYSLSKKPEGSDIRNYHEKFIAYVNLVADDMAKIVNQYTSSAVSQKIKQLSARDFMTLMNDGLESLPMHEVGGADGQWKFKYKNVAYIITNYKKHMILSFISTLPKGRNVNDIMRHVEDDIEQNFETFADQYEVILYKNSKRTIWVKMRFNYGVLSSSQITGKKLKERYHQFTNDVAPELQSRL